MADNPVLVRREGAIAVITIDNPPVNAMSHAARMGLIEAVREAGADPSVTGIVITGAGNCFVAGADVKEMSRPPREPLLTEVVEAIDAIDKPLVAAINGAALGGGLEIALACDLRIASPRASVGLPETRLGLVPGAGGTQRLPRLTGIAVARDMISGARIVKADEALALGIVDRVVDDVVTAAVAAAPGAARRRLSSLAVPPSPGADPSAAQGKPRQSSPAVREAERLVSLSATSPFRDGLAEEKRTFFALRESPEARALRHVFLAERAAERVPGVDRNGARPVSRVGVVGAGTMGAAIAAAFVDAGYSVALVERDSAGAAAGAARVAHPSARHHPGGRLTLAAAHARLGRVSSGDDWSVLGDADLIVEAAFEKMEVKTEIFGRLDGIAKAEAVLASNTSYLDLDRIAAATGRPADVVGLHFFAPANVMKLLEIVRGARTAPDVLATALAVARKLGKQPVVAGNAHGFIGNRIFSTYRRHAEYLMEDGASPYDIDLALTAFGFPMGVFAVSDLSGLDISYAMRRSLDATRDPRERYVTIADRLVEAGRLGRKTGAGYYSYATGKPEPDPVTVEIIDRERAAKGIKQRPISPEQIQRRLLAVMANEGAWLLEKGVATRGSDIDLVLINGYGFPRSKGGPIFAADDMGLAAVCDEIEAAADENPGSVQLSSLLRKVAAEGGRLSLWEYGAIRPAFSPS